MLATPLTDDGKNDASANYVPTLIILTSLFFMWGFITSLNDILIPHLKNVFSLSYTQAMLIQFCFFGAYFTVSLPAGALVRKVGYKNGIVAGLFVSGLGCLLFYPAADHRVYILFLGALFILAAGVTILQVAANPYVTVLGKPETAPARLTLTQAFNSLGTTLAPLFGAILIFANANEIAIPLDTLSVPELAAARKEEATAVLKWSPSTGQPEIKLSSNMVD